MSLIRHAAAAAAGATAAAAVYRRPFASGRFAPITDFGHRAGSGDDKDDWRQLVPRYYHRQIGDDERLQQALRGIQVPHKFLCKIFPSRRTLRTEDAKQRGMAAARQAASSTRIARVAPGDGALARQSKGYLRRITRAIVSLGSSPERGAAGGYHPAPPGAAAPTGLTQFWRIDRIEHHEKRGILVHCVANGGGWEMMDNWERPEADFASLSLRIRKGLPRLLRTKSNLLPRVTVLRSDMHTELMLGLVEHEQARMPRVVDGDEPRRPQHIE